MGIYEKLGVKRVINCFGTYTLIGGAILSDSTRDAMAEADKNFAWMWELAEKSGKHIANLLGAESAFITPGVFAGLSMAAAACIAGNDIEKMSRLPDTTGMKNEIIIQRPLRDFNYDRSMTVAGGKLVEVGDEHKGCTIEEIENAITEKTAAIHFMAHGVTNNFASVNCEIVPLKKVIEIAHRKHVPVLVDAAFQCFPIEGLRKFAAMGADITSYSCKYFGGPNTAGILVGKKDLINIIALHSFIGQEGGPGGKILLKTIPNKPHGSVFRGCKMDRASITGAVASLEEHLTTDYENIFNKAHEKIEIFKQAWNNIPGVNYEVSEIGTVAEEPGRISLHLVLDKTPEETNEIVIKLMNGNPSIWASSQGNHLVINITSFRGLMLADESDTGLIMERIKSILTK